MVALHTFRPLDFSSFPTVLLFGYNLRLGLNVALQGLFLVRDIQVLMQLEKDWLDLLLSQVTMWLEYLYL